MSTTSESKDVCLDTAKGWFSEINAQWPDQVCVECCCAKV
jgi:hypothetical protein